MTKLNYKRSIYDRFKRVDVRGPEQAVEIIHDLTVKRGQVHPAETGELAGSFSINRLRHVVAFEDKRLPRGQQVNYVHICYSTAEPVSIHKKANVQ